MRKKSSSARKKRTITPEQRAKMQTGKMRAKIRRERLAALNESGFGRDVPISKTEQMLNSVRRK